jgi:tRNA A37 threonylcarbamoyladenosine modification protein TsaB
MSILSFWVSDAHLYGAIQVDGVIYNFQKPLVPPATQATALVPFLRDCLSTVGTPALTGIIAPRGPGSFTALRVMLATAQGLLMGAPQAFCFAPSHFDVMAFHAKKTYEKDVPFLLLIDSKRNDYFGQLWNPLAQAPQNYTQEDVENLVAAIPNLCLIYENQTAMYYAEAQIHLYAQNLNAQDAGAVSIPEDRLFLPYYFNTPVYVKKHNPS